MELRAIPRIVAVNRLNDGVVIEFDDGTIGFYPEALLFQVFASAVPLDESDVAW
jgi:hypothetical protein